MPKGRPKVTASSRDKASLHLRLDFGGERSLGPGKIRLLELINETGSISAAGRALEMSYRQAWLLVDEHGHREIPTDGKLALARELVGEIAERLKNHQ